MLAAQGASARHHLLATLLQCSPLQSGRVIGIKSSVLTSATSDTRPVAQPWVELREGHQREHSDPPLPRQDQGSPARMGLCLQSLMFRGPWSSGPSDTSWVRGQLGRSSSNWSHPEAQNLVCMWREGPGSRPKTSGGRPCGGSHTCHLQGPAPLNASTRSESPKNMRPMTPSTTKPVF